MVILSEHPLFVHPNAIPVSLCVYAKMNPEPVYFLLCGPTIWG